MSDVFAERERAFEAKWAHDEEMRFKVMARRNHILGLWAAGQMGIGGAEAEAYAQTIVRAELSRAGDAAVFARIKADFAARAIARTDHLIALKMDEFLTVAELEVQAE